MRFNLVMTLLLHLSLYLALAQVKDNCKSTCGDVTVPYPFGIGDVNCALNHHFFLNCSSNGGQLQMLPDMFVSEISPYNGTITTTLHAAHDCYSASGNLTSDGLATANLGSGPYTFSATENKFAAIGCDTIAALANEEATYGVGCISFCDPEKNSTKLSSCSAGSGCCMTSIGQNLNSLGIWTGSLNNHTNVSGFNPCGYGFLVRESSFEVTEWDLASPPENVKRPEVVVEWVVEKVESCEAANANESSYACGDNTECVYSENGEGYRCRCSGGFEGTPYLPFGCKDINECENPQKYPCKTGNCKNTIGNYTCECPLGMHGDGKEGCQGFRVTTIVAVAGASIFVVILCLLLYIMWIRRKKEKVFRENGGLILKHQRVRLFTESELAKATKNYDSDRFLGEGGFGSVYKGVLPDNTLIAVKKPKDLERALLNNEYQREIGIVSQVNHKNVVKILGLCLETKVPLLVYEFISNGTLFQHIHRNRSQILKSWRNRLRIAVETAYALDYLHSLADPPIIHGDVKSSNILLDDHYTAKVSDFGASVLVSPNQQDIIATKIQGTLGYLDPEYLMTGILTEKSDVYSFGVVLVELLNGENPNSSARNGEKKNIIQYFISSLEHNEVDQIMCVKISQEEKEEIKEVAEVAKRCLNPSGVKRPSMKEVAEELWKLWRLQEKLWGKQDGEETEQLVGGNRADTINETAFSIQFSMDSL